MTTDKKIRVGLKGNLKENSKVDENKFQLEILTTDPDFQRQIVWKNVIGFILLHTYALYGLYLAITSAKLLTNFWAFFLLAASGQGVLMGAHRLYSHKSFKASRQLRLILVTLQTVAGQNCMYVWVRDHRQHHKYSDTDADPHNARRGFFFSHMGWLMSRKHPKVREKGKGINMDDLEADAIVMFQKRYYKTLYALLAVALPVFVPCYLWQEDIWNSLFVAYFLRYVLLLHGTWSVNSIAHIYGNRPYDKDIVPVENFIISKFTMGEGWHNYHHAFPYDYRAAEFGYRNVSMTTQLIDLMARIGWAKDLRTASCSMVKRRTLRKGDGTHKVITDSPVEDEIGNVNNLEYKNVNTDGENDYVKITRENLNDTATGQARDELNHRNKQVKLR